MQPRRRQQPRKTVVVWAARLRGLVRVSSSGGPSFWRQAEIWEKMPYLNERLRFLHFRAAERTQNLKYIEPLPASMYVFIFIFVSQ